MIAPFDAAKFKLDTRAQWDAHAKGWNDHSDEIRRWLRHATDAMLAMAAIGPGSRVLDIAAGAGDQTLEIADRVGPTGYVLATDLSPAILQLADENARRGGYTNIATKVADGENLNIQDAVFDAAVCRLGLMLFPDPEAGLRQMFRALRPGARACTMVFSKPEKNPCIAILLTTALKHAGLPPPNPDRPGGLLSLGKPGRIDDLFTRAGFEGVATTSVSAPFRLPSVKHYMDFVQDSAGPIVEILGRFDEAGQQRAWLDIERQLSAFQKADGWEGPNELLITVGRRP
ncbi:MAG: class I SAM-dependent methyltransferase [Bauldia sp.]|nr:class I SAM-dependent methyltransferase [Bauldia sp.]